MSTKDKTWEEREAQFAAAEASLRAKLPKGVRFRVSRSGTPGRTAHHWILDDQRGRRLLEYWPSTGTWYRRATGEKDAVENIEDLLTVLEYAIGSAGVTEEAGRLQSSWNQPQENDVMKQIKRQLRTLQTIGEQGQEVLKDACLRSDVALEIRERLAVAVEQARAAAELLARQADNMLVGG